LRIVDAMNNRPLSDEAAGFILGAMSCEVREPSLTK
jgi:hypothetical protein